MVYENDEYNINCIIIEDYDVLIFFKEKIYVFIIIGFFMKFWWFLYFVVCFFCDF